MNKKIETNEVKIKLALYEYKETKEQRANLFVNIGFAFTFGLTLLTVDFKDRLGISALTIEKVIWVFFMIFVILTIKSVFRFFYYKARNFDSVDRFISTLKGEEFIMEKKQNNSSLKNKSIPQTINLILRWCVQIIFYLIPLCLIIGLPFLVIHLVKISGADIFWFFYLVIVLFSLYSYFLMFQYWNKITQWFYDLFRGKFF